MWRSIWHGTIKNRAVPSSIPSLAGVSRALHSFTDRVKWRWHFRQSQRQHIPLRLKRKPPTAPFPFLCPPEFSSWCAHLSDAVLNNCRQLVAKRSSSRRWWSNTSFISNLARKWIVSNYVVVYGDKRGHIALLTPDDFIATHIDWFSSQRFCALRRADFGDSWWSAVSNRYAALCREVVLSDDTASLKFLMSSIPRCDHTGSQYLQDTQARWAGCATICPRGAKLQF